MKQNFKKPYDKSVPCNQKTLTASRTKQQFKAECDINVLLKNYNKTGLLTHQQQYPGDYEDLTQMEDYQTSLNQLNEAQQCFDSLPSNLRKKFHNQPIEFLEFVQNPENLPEMVTLGLAIKNPNYIPPAAIPATPKEEDPQPKT